MDKLLPIVAIVGLVILIISSVIALYPKFAKADTLICQTIMIDPPRILTYSEASEEIRNINAEINMYSTVIYEDGRKLYINPNAFICHEIKGNDDELEQRIVDEFINIVTGDLE